LEKYHAYGLDAFYMQWACNPEMFHPLPEQVKDLDVSFIGAAYGQRTEYVRFLIANGVSIRVFGRGWDRHSDIRPFWGGYLSHKTMLEVIGRSRINLNFLWTSAEKERCTIKGRTLELSACRAFQLSNYTDEFENYGFADGENIAIFHDKQDALEKIHYYLEHDEERETIASKAYDHVLQHHTWRQRFQDIFERLGNEYPKPIQAGDKYRIMLLASKGVHHQVGADDERLDVCFIDPDSDWKEAASGMDGVVRLEQSSTINKESLYMMAFGLTADKSDIIAANFYVGSDARRYWIRFIDRMMEKKREMLQMLPSSCLMFSGKYAAEHGCKIDSGLRQGKVSYVEYPSFWIKLPYYQSRMLRLYFAYHGDSLRRFRANIQALELCQALSLGVDKIWQKFLQTR